ncbi:PhzF family phenazine biosynthesis protein [Solihabitans fulvus]|uniref:PhzF family phenazine biosynthesis protein n=1 Tax=Solihabitans fulvus TaxID=1892852 RepID=A0A5B2WQA2_9PSEU|nr:PhzF family phenazine biosynthesis isomerase [Solihabitans fulvus]KAA2252706.1 PhzF family phenazine biosynthesis protein [Solihabitans fulvus]
MRVDFEIVEVFGTEPLSGGPLPVVLGAGARSDEVLLRLAARLAMPETVYLDRAATGELSVRICTPYVELGFAGHPLLGAAAVAVRRELAAPGWVRLHTRDGVVRVRVDREGRSATLEERPCAVGPEVPAEAVCAAVGLPASAAIGPVKVAGAGLAYACLPVGAATLHRARPLPERVAALPRRVPALAEVYGVAVLVPDLPVVRTRVFVPEPACAEDPATGSAALAQAAWLMDTVLPSGSPADLELRQGTDHLGYSRLNVRVRRSPGGRVLADVGGAVAGFASGTLTLDGGHAVDRSEPCG